MQTIAPITCVIACLFCATANGANWKAVSKQPDHVVYYDTASMGKRQDIGYITILQDFTSGDPSEHKSQIQKLEYLCAKHQYRIRTINRYRDSMGRGLMGDGGDFHAGSAFLQWSAHKGPVHESLSKMACK